MKVKHPFVARGRGPFSEDYRDSVYACIASPNNGDEVDRAAIYVLRVMTFNQAALQLIFSVRRLGWSNQSQEHAMKSRGIAIVELIAFCAALWSATPAAVADQGKDAELLEKIRQLEKRVAELEKQIKELHAAAKQAPRTDLEGKIIGTWVIVDADKKGAWHTDMKLNGDGTCTVVLPRDGTRTGTYRITGKQIAFSVGAIDAEFRIASFADNELVLEQSRDADKFPKHRYTRAK